MPIHHNKLEDWVKPAQGTRLPARRCKKGQATARQRPNSKSCPRFAARRGETAELPAKRACEACSLSVPAKPPTKARRDC